MLSQLRATVTVVINLVSKIRLYDSLFAIKAANIDPALCVAEVATTFPLLERFVWMSSAYANAHLHWRNPDVDATAVDEMIYPLDDPESELAEIMESGESAAYLQEFFPSNYAYAKHLGERLLQSRFSGSGTGPKLNLPHLLIIRPSCVGPALREPSPGFEVLGSAPITTLMAFAIHESVNGNRVHPMPNRNGAEFKTLVNECPVDLFVNRILAHTAHGTQGCVHGVVTGENQLTLGDYWKEYASTQPRALQPEVEWVDEAKLLAQFHSRTTGIKDELFDSSFGPIPRAFSFLGASYMFDDSKTERLWKEMTQAERETLPLMVEGRHELACALRTRKKRSPIQIARELTKYGFFSSLEPQVPTMGTRSRGGGFQGEWTSPEAADTPATGKCKSKGKCKKDRARATGGDDHTVGGHRFPHGDGILNSVVGEYAHVYTELNGSLIEAWKRARAETTRQG